MNVKNNDSLNETSINNDILENDLDSQFEEMEKDSKLSKELKKFTLSYRRSYKNSNQLEASVKDIDNTYLKKIRIKRNEIISIRKKIDTNNTELNKAYEKFIEIYNHTINDEIITDTKDKALAQKTLSFRKNVRDIDLKLDKEEKEYKETIKDKEDELASYKKNFTQIIYDLERKKKGEIQKGKKAKAEEIVSLNEMLSETNDRSKINAINERLNVIKKESLDGGKEINEKYLNLRKDEDIKNITNTFEHEKKILEIDIDYFKKKADLEFEKRKDELEYEIESKTYILAAKRADNNLKKDLIIKKNGVLVNTYDLNKELYEKMKETSFELLDLQTKYNSEVISKIIGELIDRTNLVLPNIKYVSHNLKDIEADFEGKASNAFVKSLYYFNTLTIKNLKRIVKEEYKNLTGFIRDIYEANARCECGYALVNEKIKKSFEEYKKQVNDKVNQLFNLTNKETKDVIKYADLDKTLNDISIDRLETYKELMEEINHTIISFALSTDEGVQSYSDDGGVSLKLAIEKSKYFTGEYKTATEELEAIEIIHKENEEKISTEIEQFKLESENKRRILNEAILIRTKEIEAENFNRLEAINLKYKNDCDVVNEVFKTNLRNLTGAYKTENKLIKD